ncbi:hypothetical protein PAMP_019676 [Pampus punctatissimus]
MSHLDLAPLISTTQRSERETERERESGREGNDRRSGGYLGRSSLLENPVQAILYLRELTTIVQNQQSLIQTQRARIEELDRRVDDLIGENRHLRDVRLSLLSAPLSPWSER